MMYHNPNHLFELPIYKKAMDIIFLSRSISTYINQDLMYLDSDGTEDPNIYFSGDIVQQSTSLAPEIVNAELERHSENKYRHIDTLERLTILLNRNCKRLESCNSNGREYISLLRSELQKFKHLQRSWLLTL